MSRDVTEAAVRSQHIMYFVPDADYPYFGEASCSCGEWTLPNVPQREARNLHEEHVAEVLREGV